VEKKLTVYGALGSGSVPVEAAMTLIGLDFQVIEGATWAHDAAVLARVRPAPSSHQAGVGQRGRTR
jgi:GST-like protein